MKSLFVLACLAAAYAGVARADTVTFAKHGAWTAYGGTARDGTKVCGVSAKGDNKSFHVKYYTGDKALTVQMFNTQWSAKKGTRVDFTMTFDRLSPWTGVATSYLDSNGDTMLQFDIPSKQVELWIREFRDSLRLSLEFPKARASGWSVDLTGTTEISNKFTLCLKAMQD